MGHDRVVGQAEQPRLRGVNTIEEVFHIATPAEAERLRADGHLEPDSLATEGFVHCSTASQVVDTTARYFEPDAHLVLVQLDTDMVENDLQWPEVYPGQHFPHLHAPVEMAAVVAIIPWGPAERERWQSQ